MVEHTNQSSPSQDVDATKIFELLATAKYEPDTEEEAIITGSRSIYLANLAKEISEYIELDAQNKKCSDELILYKKTNRPQTTSGY